MTLVSNIMLVMHVNKMCCASLWVGTRFCQQLMQRVAKYDKTMKATNMKNYKHHNVMIT